MKGIVLLKVSSFFLLIWGLLNVIVGIFLIADFSMVKELALGVKEDLIYLSMINFLGIGILEWIAAKLGFAAAKHANKANRCVLLGGLVFAMTVAPLIYGDLSAINWGSYIATMFFPLLYVLGALLRKNSGV